METAVVTGATSGIGKEVAKKLACEGYRVVLACRNRSLAFEVQQEIIDGYPDRIVEVGPTLDASSIENVRTFARSLGDQPITLLINNAGMNTSDDVISEDGIPLVVQVNYVVPYMLTRLLVPQLEKAKRRAKVINVSSVLHRDGCIQDHERFLSNCDQGDYPNSKLALVMFSHEFKKRHGATIDCCCVDPGAVRTKIFDSLIFGRPPFRWCIDACYAPPEDAALTILHAIESWPSTKESPFFARGLFAMPWVTQYMGYRDDVMGRIRRAAFLSRCLLASLLDYPLRRVFDAGIFHSTQAVRPLACSLDREQCRDLWTCTENLLSLSPSSAQSM